MKKTIENDLAYMTEALEEFVSKLGTLPEEDKIDLAARLKPVAKSCKIIDEEVKLLIKSKLKHKEGFRLGTLFKAVLKLVACKRLDQSLLKEQEPQIWEQYCADATDERVTFELR